MNFRNLFRRKPRPFTESELTDINGIVRDMGGLIADNEAARTNARAIRESAEINRELAAEHPEWTAYRRRQLLRGTR